MTIERIVTVILVQAGNLVFVVSQVHAQGPCQQLVLDDIAFQLNLNTLVDHIAHVG